MKFGKQISKIPYIIIIQALILFQWFGINSALAAHAKVANTQAINKTEYKPKPPINPFETSFSLDGVFIHVQASSWLSPDFTVSEPGSAGQVATSMSLKPYQELSITAVPFGYKPATEKLPIAEAGGKTAYENSLREFRLQQGGLELTGLTVDLFDQQIVGVRTFVDLPVDGFIPKSIMIDEWVVEAGQRLWIVRASQELDSTGPISGKVMFPTDLILSSTNLDNLTTLPGQPGQDQGNPSGPINSSTNLHTPAWWHGDCDGTTYSQNSGGIAAYRLGAVYLGAPACGPRPYYDSSPDVLVHFFSGSWGVYEWECVEYSMRFLYLMYGITPYQANGSQVVGHYSGNQLVQIANGTVGKAPQPNDVLSYGSTSSFGHTSVVYSSDVKANGSGSISVIEENASASGSSTLAVTNWVVAGNAGAVSGWLHNPAQDLPTYFIYLPLIESK